MTRLVLTENRKITNKGGFLMIGLDKSINRPYIGNMDWGKRILASSIKIGRCVPHWMLITDLISLS